MSLPLKVFAEVIDPVVAFFELGPRDMAEQDSMHDMTAQHQGQGNDPRNSANALIKIVRESTERFKDVSVAEAEGYALQFGRVSGPDSGAMGLHHARQSGRDRAPFTHHAGRKNRIMSFMHALHTHTLVGALFGCLGFPAVALSQAAAPPQPPKNTAPAFTPSDTTSALAHKAGDRGAMLSHLGDYPDITGSGPYPATYAVAPNGMEDVVYAPEDLSLVKGKLGVYIWGNGACGYDATGARFHLTEIASHGYVAIAPGEVQSGPKAIKPLANSTQQPTASQGPDKRATPEKMLAALDWILAENQRESSPYYEKINPEWVAFSGHSCGGLIAMKAALDPRAKALVMENSGVFRQPPSGVDGNDKMAPVIKLLSQMKKEDLVKLHTPVLYILGGPQDIAEPNGLDDFQHIQHVPVFVADHPGAGHAGLFLEPNGEATKLELDWLHWQLHKDHIAARTFTGPDCILCRDFRWVVYRKGIE